MPEEIEPPDELLYETSVEANMAIARALSEMAFWRRMEVLMPLVAERLAAMGVDFSKVPDEVESPSPNTSA